MKVPINWLKDYVEINEELSVFAEGMTMSGSKVEALENAGDDISGVVVGKITEIAKHPDADRLQVTQVEIGEGKKVQVVTAATNIKLGDVIPVALIGANLPGGLKIKKGKLRGVESEGMMCSINELNLTKDEYPDASEEGIFILPSDWTLGSDVKEILALDEPVVDFEITSNRPDCLSVIGIAREAAATFDKKLNLRESKVSEEGQDISKYADVEIKAADLCTRYAARVVTDVKIEPSPMWMKKRLKAAGVRPVNNIVDITNYVMLEYGQPMHAFDLSKLEGSKIIVRKAEKGEKMNTLDDQPRELDDTMLVIADAKKAVAVAGVMGGANSEISDDTRTILFESAMFNPVSVRLTAKKIGLRTESSARFEKGLDPEGVYKALERAAELVEELGAGVVCKGVIDRYPEKVSPRKMKLDVDAINKLLGTTIEKGRMIEILKGLSFEVDEKTLEITVPTFRQDVETGADVAEEVARIYGYNNIEATLLSGKATCQGMKTYKQKTEEIIKETMIACGLNEIYTYSFVSPKVYDLINAAKDDPIRNVIKLSNPLGEDFSIMRTTTLPSMLEALARNYSRRAAQARLFEMSYIYVPSVDAEELPQEKQVLTVGIYGETDFYDLKGIVEELLARLGIKNYEIAPMKDNPSFHPGRTASLYVKGRNAGIFGEVHPDVCENFEAAERTYAAMFDVASLIENSNFDVEFRQLPKYPAVSRDLAFLVNDEITVGQIDSVMRKKAGRNLEDVKLFDIYKGKQVPDGMKSVAFALTFRENDRTLTDAEVDESVKNIVNALQKTFDVKLRQ